MGYNPTLFKLNWLAIGREAEASSQAPIYVQPAALVVIPTQQTEASFIHTASYSSSCTHSTLVTMYDQTQKSLGYCAIHTPARKQCPKEYHRH